MLSKMLHSEKTAYVFASILLLIFGLIIFCCCRIWYDLLGCAKRRGRGRGNHHQRGGGVANIRHDGDILRGPEILSDHDESRCKPLTNSGEVIYGNSNNEKSVLPVMKIVVTNPDKVEQQIKSKLRPELETHNANIEMGHQRVKQSTYTMTIPGSEDQYEASPSNLATGSRNSDKGLMPTLSVDLSTTSGVFTESENNFSTLTNQSAFNKAP